MVRCTDRPTMTLAVELGRKATKQTNKQTKRENPLGQKGLMHMYNSIEPVHEYLSR